MGVGLIPCQARSSRRALHPISRASAAAEGLTAKLHAVQEVFSFD